MTGKAVPFGIYADSGTALELVTTDALSALIATDTQKKLGTATKNALVMRSKGKYGLTAEASPDDLAQAGWGVVFAAEVEKPQDILDALAPLIELRQKQAGKLFKIFKGDDGPCHGETASVWLERHGASLNTIDPTNGVPYYLALIGDPNQISFEFQYSLDLVAAVGRIDFPEPEHYRVYADNIVKFESDEKIKTRREMALFATCHDFDEATQLFSEQVAQPLVNGTDVKQPLGKEYGFTVKQYLAKDASKKTLKAILGGSSAAKPSILFSGTHGMAFKMGDERQLANQGALVCADWPGDPPITADHWFAASDVPPDADLAGLIHFVFACYGAGTPQEDNFNQLGTAKEIAPQPMTARLPQQLMLQGALACLGHIDKAWAFSFQGQNGLPQTQGFRNLISQLMKGRRLGHATDQLNAQWAVLTTELVSLHEKRAMNVKVDESGLLSKWIARDDARNYVVLGDPAVKLRPEPLADVPSE